MSNNKILAPDESIAKVEGWIKSSNFANDSSPVNEYNEALKADIAADDSESAITSVTKQWEKKNAATHASMKLNLADAIKIQNTSTVNSHESAESMTKLVETLKTNTIKGVSKIGSKPSWELYEGRTKSKSEPPDQFSTIIEAEESVRLLNPVIFAFISLMVAISVFHLDYLAFFLFSPF